MCFQQKVIGILRAKNVHLSPYQAICNICQQTVSPTHAMNKNNSHYTKCGQTTMFTYKPYLQCILETKDKLLECNLCGTLLQQCFPELAAIPFEIYSMDMSCAIYLMQQFELQATFIITMNNAIVSIINEPTTVSYYNFIFFNYTLNKCHSQNLLLISKYWLH